MSDPKLKDARAQITKLCRRLDIACHVVLHNEPGEAELFFHVAPSYSKVRIDIDAMGQAVVRGHSSSSDYRGDPRAQSRDPASTANMVSVFAEMLANHALLFLEAAKFVDATIGARHTELEKTEPPDRGLLQ